MLCSKRPQQLKPCDGECIKDMACSDKRRNCGQGRLGKRFAGSLQILAYR